MISIFGLMLLLTPMIMMIKFGGTAEEWMMSLSFQQIQLVNYSFWSGLFFLGVGLFI